MKMKGVMLITFLLLAVLAIGAVSAEDTNATSDDLQVADDGDDVIALKDYDEDEHYIDVYDEDEDGEIDLDDDESEVAYIYLPTGTTKGSFGVYNGEEEVAHLNINLNDDHWDSDDEDVLTGYLYVEDLDLAKIKNGDTLAFKFFEYKNSQYVELMGMTVLCKVKITGSTMILTEIDTDAEAEISVNDIDLSKPDENFAFLNVTEMIGTFIVTVETDDDDNVVFKEDLLNTERPYSEFDDEYGTHYYCFAFSLEDLNNYVAQNFNGADSFVDLIDKKVISSGDEMYFELYEDEDDEDSDLASESRTITIKDGKVLFDDDEEDVEIDPDELNIAMDNGWNETVVLEYSVKRGIKGKIVIYLNDDQTPAFDRNIRDCEPVDYDPDDEFDLYDITIADLNITQAGEYVLRYYFDDENGNHICSYDDEDPETLVLIPSNIVTGDNASIIVHHIPIRVDENITVITISVADGQPDDEVLIYVDGNETPIRISLDECDSEDGENYTISSGQLHLGVGNHTLNITFKGVNALDNVTILTDLEIDIADWPVYTTLNDAFVYISLEDDDITEDGEITGLINVTITDSEGNLISTIEKDIEDGMNIDSDLQSFVIYTNEMGVELNGTYTVSVRYYNGNKGFVQEEGNVTFKELGADDYGISINDFIDDERIIIFSDLPLDYDIVVSIDGNESIFSKSSLRKGLDSQNNTVFFINQTQLNLTDGTHSIGVSIDIVTDIINLLNANVTVDLKENVDPELTISVGNVEVGNAAIVLIKTNSTFTGTVDVQLANNTYSVNVENGQGNVSVAGLDVGTYNATAIFAGDVFFLSSVKNATFSVTAKPVQPEKKDTVKPVVKKKTVKLVLKKVKVKRSAKKLVLQATLKINGKAVKGKKITFKFKGKKYRAKTNKKGVAKVTIKKKVLRKLKKGKKVTYRATYGKITKKVTVKVKK